MLARSQGWILSEGHSTIYFSVVERALLAHLSIQVNTSHDPLQFAYRLGIGVENVMIYLLQWAHSHLAITGSTMRIMFFDFSSAFTLESPKNTGECLHNCPDYWLSDKQITVCETEGLGVWEGGQQHRCTTGECTLTVSLHSVQLRLPYILKWLQLFCNADISI